MRVLLIEDEKYSAYITSKMLNESDFVVQIAELGEEGYSLGSNCDFDIILLDLDLPDMSGFDVLRKLRESKIKTPILILSGNTSTNEKIIGLEQGADDYVTKPYDRNELVARMQAVIRRTRGLSDEIINIKDVKIDISGKTVYRNNEVVRLTSKEFQLIELFALRKGITVSKEVILDHLYTEYNETDIKSIDVLVFNLRRKLGPPEDAQKYIETIWGRGYILRNSGEESGPDIT